MMLIGPPIAGIPVRLSLRQDGAAMHALDSALALQGFEVGANGHLGHLEPLRGLLDRQ